MDSLRILCAGLMLLSFAGCGESKTYGTLTGKVTFNGKPLTCGSVMLQSETGGHPATGIIQQDGTFTMQTTGAGEGVATGKNRVRVTCFEGQRPEAKSQSGDEIPLGRSIIPMKYTHYATSGLVVEVMPGENEPLLIELGD